jgi:glycosyltransferase involved in cell wall biosynthesis
MKISAYYANYFKDFGIAHACYYLMKGMQSKDVAVKLMGISSDPEFNDAFYSDAIPKWSKSLVYRAFPDRVILNMAESIFSNSLKNADFAYLWPGISLETYKDIKSRGYKIIHECVNTHEAYSKTILDAEYKALKLPITHGVSAEKIADMTAKLELSDYIYSCSPIMTATMLSNGVAKSKILQTSYGLSPSAIFDRQHVVQSNQPTFIFVGSIGVRKGIHLLLDYWVKAKLNAKLKLVGAIEDAVKPLVTQYLSHENIEHIPFTSDLPSIYKNADIFILPSLEEGSPLVMYMALGAGLPVIVSPMGGGGVIVDNEDGFVVDPHDADKWIERMRQLAESAECRAHLSRQSKVKATHYVWDAVAKDRLQSLEKAESESI